jgi:acetyl esterase
MSFRAVRASTLAALRLPAPVLRRLAGPARDSGDGKVLDLQLQVVLRLLELAHAPSWEALGVRRARLSMDLSAPILDRGTVPGTTWSDRTIPGPGGPLAVRFYAPEIAQRVHPAIVYLHGGGFVLGSLQSHHGLCGYLSARTRCKVIAVDYRLSPEHKFPAALDDAMSAFRWVASHAADLGILPHKIALAGDSAGGNLTAVLSLLLRDDDCRPAFQLPIYPAVDLTRSFPSHKRFAAGYYLTAPMIDWFLGQYLEDPEQARDVRASPWFATDLKGLPPCMILTAGFDPLRDEGLAWAGRMAEAGVEVTSECCGGLIHGFANMGEGIAAAGEAIDRACERLSVALHR